MNPEELILTTTREALEEATGAFQGFQPGKETLQKILSKTWQFRRRGLVEDDPRIKQLIPYCIIVQDGKILAYTRGASGGEKKLHAKMSVGIGGHINPQDGMPNNVYTQLREGMLREIQEEINLPRAPKLEVAGLLNDDSNPVGEVHLGVVVTASIPKGPTSPKEGAIENPQFLSPEELAAKKDQFENWSQIVIDHLEEILPEQEFHFSLGNSTNGQIGACAAILAKSKEEAVKILQEEIGETLSVRTSNPAIQYLNVYFNPEAITTKAVEGENLP
jgi:predicted NUDIX family phosphoesterase